MPNKEIYPTIGFVDHCNEYREKIDVIAKWVHDKNPFDLSPAERRKFKLKSNKGSTIKLALDLLYSEMEKDKAKQF